MSSKNTNIYSKHHAEGYLIFSPWFNEAFKKYYDEVLNGHTLVKEDRCYIIQQLVKYCFNLPGDLAECGVYQGGTARLMADTMLEGNVRNKKLLLFDTFEGMPEIANQDRSGHKQGDFGDTSLIGVQKYLSSFNFIEFHAGFIPNTFSAVKGKQFSFVHIDVDLYQTVLDCCEFFYPKLSKGGIFIFDDYGFRKYELAAKLAVDEFFADKPEVPFALPTGQGIVIKV